MAKTNPITDLAEVRLQGARFTKGKAPKVEIVRQEQEVQVHQASKRGTATYYLDRELIARLQNAVVYLGGHPTYLTVSGVVEEALWAAVEALEAEHHGGAPFPHRARPVRTGRPRGPVA